MRIIHVITRLLKAGSEENTLATCLHQIAAGHEVHLVHGAEFEAQYRATLPAALNLIETPEMVHPVRPLKDAAALMALRRLYLQLRPDVVHTHQSKAGVLGRLAAVGTGTPAVVHTVHIAPFLNVGAGARLFYVAAERACAAISDRIINVSEGMRQACLDHGVGRAEQHRVVRSGMALERFVGAAAPADWRGRIGGWDGAERPRIVLMLAAFEPRKRQAGFLRALAPWLSARRDVCVLFAGQGGELEPCRALADALGIGHAVRFLGHDPEPESLIALADLCVLTSEREGLPRVLVQYLAGGRPVVVSSLPGVEEVVADTVNGLITPADDLNAAAAAVQRLCADPQALARLAQGAAATDVSPWALERMGRDIEAIYREILTQKGRTPSSGARAGAGA